MQNRSVTPETNVITIILVALACFSVARLALWVDFHSDFEGLTSWQLVQAFVVGLRFDLSILAVALFVPLLMLLVAPVSDTPVARWWHHGAIWLAYIVCVGLVVLMIADHLYFEDTHRHVGAEIKAISEDWVSLLNLAWRQYAVVTLLLLLALMASAKAWQWRFSRPVRRVTSLPSRVAVIALFVCVSFVAARGGVLYRPISVSDAFFSNQVTQGYLVLNGPYSIARAWLAPSLAPANVMPLAQAQQRVTQLFRDSFHTYSTGLNFQAVHTPAAQPRPNVVILLLESWGATQVDAMRQQAHLPKLGATPNFDQLAQSGRLFTHFYASGQRSIVGLSTLMTGLPVLPGMPAMGDGLEQLPINFMGDIAQSQGYQTFFIQSSERMSLKLNALSARAGFQTYLGAEDMPEQHAVAKPSGVWGTWDHNTLQEANKQFAQAKQPFLGMVFTSTTHGPWLTPDARWDKFPKNSDMGLAMNSLYYADWALGEFIAAAKKAGYYNNTLFILLADHASQFIDKRDDARNLFHIPMLIVGPGVQPGIDARVGGQPDVFATVVDATGWAGAFKTTGHSLLRPPRAQGVALGVSDSVVTLVNHKGWVSHNLAQRLGSGAMSEADAHAAEQDLLALYQITTHAQLADKGQGK